MGANELINLISIEFSGGIVIRLIMNLVVSILFKMKKGKGFFCVPFLSNKYALVFLVFILPFTGGGLSVAGSVGLFSPEILTAIQEWTKRKRNKCKCKNYVG